MPSVTPTEDILGVVRRSKYPLGAFLFVQRGLDFTVRQEHGELDDDIVAELDPHEDIPSRHVTGQQLCTGLRQFAVKEYGLMARTVLRRWNICRSEDFGAIVFAMVEAGLMHKTDSDRLEDFCGVFDFGAAFGSHNLSLSDQEAGSTA